MMNITYLFGAGASYNACPILNELGDKMIELPDYCSKQDFLCTSSKYDSIKSLIELIFKVGKKSKEFNTIDTYAKKLFLLDKKQELKELKLAVSLFFTIWSLAESKNWKTIETEKGHLRECKKVDPRYISLLATYLEKGEHYPKLRHSVNFITWNYDLQLEEAYRLFTEIEEQNFNVVNKYFPFFPNSENISKIKCCHLNGFHGYYGKDEGRDLFNRSLSNDLAKIVEEMLFISEPDPNRVLDFNHFINYAWEDSELSQNARQRAIDILSKTTHLVVVGYSFPPFNYDVDKKLMESLGNKFDTIIIQDPKVDPDFIAETFNIRRNKIREVRDVNQFVIPNFNTIKRVKTF